MCSWTWVTAHSHILPQTVFLTPPPDLSPTHIGEVKGITHTEHISLYNYILIDNWISWKVQYAVYCSLNEFLNAL